MFLLTWRWLWPLHTELKSQDSPMTKEMEGAKPETDWLGGLVLMGQKYQLETNQWPQARI